MGSVHAPTGRCKLIPPRSEDAQPWAMSSSTRTTCTGHFSMEVSVDNMKPLTPDSTRHDVDALR